MKMRRGRYMIIRDVLRKCQHYGVLKTEIMYHCNLSFTQLQQYVDELVDKGFLMIVAEEHGKKRKRIYQTTRKGVELLKRLEEVALMVDNPNAVFDVAVATSK